MSVSVPIPVDPVVERRRRQTAAATAAFRNSFASDEERSAYMREIGLRGQAGRIGLKPEDAAAVLAAYRLLGQIAARYKLAERDLPAVPAEGAGDV